MGAPHSRSRETPNSNDLDSVGVVLDAARAHELLGRASGHLRSARDTAVSDWLEAQLQHALHDVERATDVLRHMLSAMDDH